MLCQARKTLLAEEAEKNWQSKEGMNMARYPAHGVKCCSACGKEQEFAAFYQRQNESDGRMDICISCFKERSPTKVCDTCQQPYPIDDFAIHPSSIDGHRHTCNGCVEQKRAQEKEARKERRREEAKRREEEAVRRKEQYHILKAYGYWWKKEEVWGDEWDPEPRETYVLYTPERDTVHKEPSLIY
jgi:hypothetical protein